MSENGEIYTAGRNFTLPPALTGWTNSTSALPLIKKDHIANTALVMILVILRGLCELLHREGGPQGEQAWQVGARRGQFFIDGNPKHIVEHLGGATRTSFAIAGNSCGNNWGGDRRFEARTNSKKQKRDTL